MMLLRVITSFREWVRRVVTRQDRPSEGSNADRCRFDTPTTEVVHSTLDDETCHEAADDSEEVDNADVLQLPNPECIENSEPDTESSKQQQLHTSDIAAVEPNLPEPPTPPDAAGQEDLSSGSDTDTKPSSKGDGKGEAEESQSVQDDTPVMAEPDGSQRCDSPDIGQPAQPTDAETTVLDREGSDKPVDSVESHGVDCSEDREALLNQETVDGDTETPTPPPTLPKEPQAGGSDKAESVELTPPSTETQETRGPDQPIIDTVDTKLDLGDGGRGETSEPTKSPREIEGRRTNPNSRLPKRSDDADTLYTSKPELICRERPGEWEREIVLSVPADCRISEVRHNGTILSADNAEYRLSSFSGNLSVEYIDGKMDEISLADDQNTPLVFKTRRDWKGEGRKVKGITKGCFIVVAPSAWNREGPVPVEPQGCVDHSFLVHFFHVDDNTATDEVGGFEEYGYLITQAGFALEGKRVSDDSEHGDLFVGAYPRLETAPGIVWARVGEEKEHGWQGENFKPAEKSLKEVLDGRQGRFFVRVYDTETQIVDSGEFRYWETLQEIRMNDEPYSPDALLIPSIEGHSTITLRFVGVDGNTLHPTLKMDNSHSTVGPDGVVKVLPCPDPNEVACSLSSETDNVDIMIRLPRVWWRLGQSNKCSDKWRDTPLTMTREEFRQSAKADAVVQLRLPPHIRSVRVGFGGDMNRIFLVPDGLPLRSFIDYDQIDHHLNKDVFLQIQCGKAVLPLIRVTKDQPPSNPNVPASRLRRQDIPYARVKKHSDGGFRQGKGFSRGELRGAGFSLADSAYLHIRIDPRRRSVHGANIDILEEVALNARG